MAALTYPERRAQAIALAAATDGWGRPPTPEGSRFSPRYMPAKQARNVADARYIGPVDRYRCCTVKWNLRTDAYFAAKERNQNREKFD